MYVRYALLADAAVPGGGGKWNIIGTFTTLNAPGFPVRHPRMSLIVRLEAHVTEVGTHALEIELVDQDGQRLGGPPEQQIDIQEGVPGTPPSLEVAVEINNLTLPAAGNYEFAIKVDGAYLDSAPLYVRQLEQA